VLAGIYNIVHVFEYIYFSEASINFYNIQ